jgi:hypothetical protein
VIFSNLFGRAPCKITNETVIATLRNLYNFPHFMNKKPHVAIVGATGAVGREMLTCLEERNFPLSKLNLLASARSAGKRLEFRGQELTVEELTPESFHGIELAVVSRKNLPPLQQNLSVS